MNPKDSMAFMNRGMSYEKIGNADKAMADYQKAVDLDGTNESAKSALKRMQDEQAKLAAAKSQPAAPRSSSPNLRRHRSSLALELWLPQTQ